MKRREFIQNAALSTLAVGTLQACNTAIPEQTKDVPPIPEADGNRSPLVISTWNHGLPANTAAWDILRAGGQALDAVEAGVRTAEANPEVSSVGYGGWPDREGQVTLDACIMDHKSNAGAVAFLQHIKHPISVARKVMEETPHVMLVGEGALQFALDQGFRKEELLTEKALEAYRNWREKSQYKPVINIENHDTISMLALDVRNNIAGACTTSGAAWKMHGRVGDSPLIGSGLFLDNEVGGAAATGLGEAIIKTAGSAMVVELMRNGASPEEACKEVVDRIERIYRNSPDREYLQVGFIALNKAGGYGSYCLRPGFNYAVQHGEMESTLIDATYKIS
ncbi:N(4)-(beta-N-acetylglucosaminyl)-L-asparaginase [Robertkochia sediminum]|uniref:N(4)-(beta-N-acetylglucosaminyl)-L-asparaginase n=1 Tax=Robertkochia sediminum TaxID=2785326 RepID=UPI001931D804|nr:N(4)-(beta-N-acetylglucosaminyl)-L-asparaginase [Robertkochia sediminum]MBL7472391.1 N(4)-(beta-N-acetylglucosaminyl)-L-asparaginase [Robertkochia sediminum]